METQEEEVICPKWPNRSGLAVPVPSEGLICLTHHLHVPSEGTDRHAFGGPCCFFTIRQLVPGIPRGAGASLQGLLCQLRPGLAAGGDLPEGAGAAARDPERHRGCGVSSTTSVRGLLLPSALGVGAVQVSPLLGAARAPAGTQSPTLGGFK